MATPLASGAGDLRHRVAFDERAEAADDYGGTVGEFEPQFTVAAAIQVKPGGEGVLAARLEGRQPVIITVRQSEATRRITPAWRARDVRSGTIYAVRSVSDPDDKRRFLEILCETGVAA